MTALDGPDGMHAPGGRRAPHGMDNPDALGEVLSAVAGQPNPLNAISTGSQPAERHIERVAGSAPPPAARGLAGPDALRELVREVLREVLPVIAGQPNPLNAISTGSQPVERHIERVAGSAPAPAARGLAGPDALRELARQTLRDLLPVVAAADRAVSPVQAIPPGGDVRVNGGILASAAGSAAAGPGGAVRAVRLASDDDLHSFVVEVLRLAGDPRRRQEMLAGRLRFTLAGLAGSGHNYTGTSAGWPAASAGTPPTVRRVDKGAVTERAVIAAAKAGERLVLGPRAVLTPLARDKARTLGVPVEKER